MFGTEIVTNNPGLRLDMATGDVPAGGPGKSGLGMNTVSASAAKLPVAPGRAARRAKGRCCAGAKPGMLAADAAAPPYTNAR